MKLSRRGFFSAFLFTRPAQSDSHKATVLETFDINGSTVAVLANHESASDRERFARWLRSTPKATVRIRTPSGIETTASVFRVRMCFGRALILLHEPLHIRERSTITLLMQKP